MMDLHPLEERCLVDEGEAILNKKAVYEPTKGQKFRQIVCSKTWALCILFSMALVVIAVAAMAAFARPGFSSSTVCGNNQQMINGTSDASTATGQPKKLNYIATNGEPFPWHDIRLPISVVPQDYDIFLHPNISASFFEGNITMTLAVKEKTDFVVFHTLELNLTTVKVSFITSSGTRVKSGGQTPSGSSQSGYSIEKETEVKVVKELEFVAHQQMYVKLDQMLEAGRVIKLRVGFRGSLAGLARMSGFYKSSYFVNGQQRFMASTQFEASSARRAFPCFDEPEMKATFSMSIVRDSKHITLFNTPLKTTSPYQETLLLDHYEKTLRMSTYLVAYVVCDFKSISSKTKDGVLVRVFAPEDKIYMGQYALDGAVKIIEYYNDFFGIAYPLKKQDLIAIPNFAAGAMENWGLITYRDTAILYDPKVSTESSKEWIATVVAHELAHQWFGNLVTMTWWSDIWLNEGFASFMEYLGAGIVDKDFHMDVKYTEALTDALNLDSLSSSHPIEIAVHDPAEIEAAFDSISYDKGACLIHMLRSVIGPANFKQGLSDYLHQHAYGNAETKDLWDAFEKVSKLPGDLQVDKVMNTWTKQMGYPLVTVTLKAGKLFLTQEHFLLNRNTEKVNNSFSPFGYKWHIPFTYTTSEDPQTANTVWMKMGSAEATLPSSSSPAWVKGNAKSDGYYRVNYDENGWKAISQQLKTNHEVFSVQDRVGLLDDVFSLAWTGIVDYSIALDLSTYLVKETNYFVWVTAIGHLNSLKGRLYLHESYDNLKALMLSLVKPMVDSLGWDNKGDHLERKMRALMLRRAVHLGYQPAVDEAQSLFESWKANQSVSLNNDLRSIIYSTGVKYGTKKDWDLVFERYRKCKVPSEAHTLLNSLSTSSDARTLQIFMEYSMDDQKVKSQDTASVISLVADNPIGFLYSWRFLRDKWDIFFQRYGHGSFTMNSIIKAVVQRFSTQFDYDEVTAFFEGKDLGSATLGLKQAKEVVMSHIIWEKKNLDKVSTWLQDSGRSFNQGRKTGI